MKPLLPVALGLVLAAVTALVSCGGNDVVAGNSNDSGANDGNLPPLNDGGRGTDSGDASSTRGDAGAGLADADAAGDGGPQDFSVFVKELINNHTNETELPATLPADGVYTDNQSLANYPATFF